MYISKISLVNYRNFASANFSFNPGINTIIGENGCGKTNLFRAMRLLLEDASYQFAYKLNETDFNRALGDWKGHWIIISIEFDDISYEESIQALFVHGTGVIGEENYLNKATYNLFFRPKADIRLKLSELEHGDKAGLEAILDSINVHENYETVFTGKSIADFTDQENYKELVGDFDEVKFSFDIDSSKFGIKIPHQLSVAKEISFTFIQALRDVVSDFHNNRTNPLLTLLKNKSGEIKEIDYQPIGEMVELLNEKIETLPDVQSIRTDIKDTIRDAVGETYSPSSLSIKSSLSSEANKLLQSLKLFIGEPGETHEGGIHELSLGGANLIFLTLKLLEYKYQKSKETFANFLIIEEPEAHIHTHIQRSLFDKLEYGDTQIIYSTHSTYISEVSNINNVNILAKQRNYAEVFSPTKGLDEPRINKVQRYLDAVRSNLLFAKGIILVEGDAEEILIPTLVKTIYGVSLDELGISLINIGSTGFENVAQLFHEERIRRKCSIITDLDSAITDTTITEADSPAIAKYKGKVERSSKSGQARQVLLDNFVLHNRWLKPFYATYTFEVDFILAGNSKEIENVLNKEKIYEEATKNKALEEIKNGKIEEFGKRILTIAKQEGKGWFAIMLGNYISPQTIIPDYILNAILFAKDSFSISLIEDIIRYRIGTYTGTLNIEKVNECLKDFSEGKCNLESVIVTLENIIPNDQVINFLKKLA